MSETNCSESELSDLLCTIDGCECKESDTDYLHKYFYCMDGIKGDCCPKCGCKSITSVGNTETYPDNWTQYNCAGCGHLIAEIDNSPMYTCWEFEDNTIVA